ncbi:DUF3906 family protein [Fictibacillus sp. Mic-4]|uniref:DUF3906 family protein n=1 Tax=Fictibacillus TaxID=1329200 RepID=UPI0003F7EC4E|nr:DUF3906 family protein [Fictibacillus gelatini]
MNLYRFEVVFKTGSANVVIAAENDESAFSQVEVELEKHFLKVPEVKEISLYEKKKIKEATGFVFSLEPV